MGLQAEAVQLIILEITHTHTAEKLFFSRDQLRYETIDLLTHKKKLENKE